MAEQRREVEVKIKVQHEGYGADITAICTVDQIPGLIRRLREHGIEPANTPYVGSVNAQHGQEPAAPGATESSQGIWGTPPTCSIHGTPMKPSRKPNTWFCSRRVGVSPDGTPIYCSEKVELS